MAPAVEVYSPYHRPHSTSELLSPSRRASSYMADGGTGPVIARPQQQRSFSLKSVPTLPAFDIPVLDLNDDLTTSLRFEPKIELAAARTTTAIDDTVVCNHLQKASRKKSLGSLRRASWLPGSRSSLSVQDAVVCTEVEPLPRPRTAGSFADFAKRAWRAKSPSPCPHVSRSPSPSWEDPAKQEGPESGRLATGLRLAARKLSKGGSARRPADADHEGQKRPSSASRSLNRASIYLTRIKLKQQSLLKTVDSTNAPNPNSSLPHIHLNPRSSSQTRSSTASSTSGTAASENASQSTVDTGVTVPSRDPLWGTFRTLDGDFNKFLGKNSTSARMAVVRSALVPFLRGTAYHPSNSSREMLSFEDVERRATLLNRWWNALLDMLGPGGIITTAPSGLVTSLQPVAGVDRPTLLEVTTMIMMRPEWRILTRSFQPVADRRDETSDDSDKASTASAFAAESAERSVRTVFQTKLLAQMTVVVDRMSQRHAPLSMVNWCGKACAYAFFFVPGMADVLVRQWGLNGEILRRVADELGLPRRSNGENDDLVALFPYTLVDLAWSSNHRGDRLRRASNLPAMAGQTSWHGPCWLTRWRGGDTDLFFIFCKYYFILAGDFMPAGLPLAEMARAPAFVPMHAQMLSILDTTIHRQASIDAALMGPPLSDALHGADAALMPMTVSSNVLKGMDENRLIVLLKDVLSEHVFVSQTVKHTFAQSFLCVMKAATKKTSRYDHGAHLVLFDFLEEALMTLHAFQRGVDDFVGDENDYVDWAFWLDVCKRIMTSNNTMSEVRLLSFVFAVWHGITAGSARKEAVCIDWLLSEDVFERFFNNWCPMVRAYYMRLLCWRLCRDAGRVDDLDTRIFLLVSQRLKTAWSHYLWLKERADVHGRLPPSTAPCLPSPGKRFMIVKSEVQAPLRGLVLGFDHVSHSFMTRDAAMATYLGQVTAGNAAPNDAASDAGQCSHKKKWTLLGKVLSFNVAQANVGLGDAAVNNVVATGNPSLGAGCTSRPGWDDDLETARREMAASRGGNRSPQGFAFHQHAPPDSSSSTGSSPIYEAARVVFRFALASSQPPHQHQSLQLRDRVLTRPRLPASAQARATQRNSKSASYFPPVKAALPSDAQEKQSSAAARAGNSPPNLSVTFDFEETRPWPPPKQQQQHQQQQQQQPQRTGAGSPQVRPVRPLGVSAAGAAYVGRALAEWALVVGECNNFVDRRRDEGVVELGEVEVPALVVEGMGMRGVRA